MSYRKHWSVAFAVIFLIGALGFGVGRATADHHEKSRYFEMRTYTAAPGKIDALHARFRDHTVKMFAKHGMENIGYWVPSDQTPADENQTLTYILAYPDKEAREKAWKGFMGDPKWQAAYKESVKDGRLVAGVDSRFFTATDYSAIR